MNWLALESSVFGAAAYHAGKRRLFLRFRSGDVYCYFEFPAELWNEFLAADSRGRYFSHNIRDQFEYRQIRRSHGLTGKSALRTVVA